MTSDRDHATSRTGTVTAVRAQQRDPRRVSVHIDGRFAFGLPADAAVDLGLRKGVSVDDDLLERARRADASYRARQRALGYLAHRPRTEREVRDRLRRAGFEDPVIDDCVSRLAALGYLDDESFALSYARARAAARGYGPMRILVELRRKGVPDQAARAAVGALASERDPYDDALDAGRRAWRRIGGEPDPRRRRARLYGTLARRGFEPDTIARVIETLERQP